MRTGIYAVTLAQGSSRGVLRIGWFRQQVRDPDEYDVRWCTIYRDGYMTLPSEVWDKGPEAAKGWTWGPQIEAEVHRFHFIPLARLRSPAWKEIVGPEPKWEDWES